ncbi:MAG: FecR family protein [Tannerella sp.]|nr:FecR family protein [Tannerella sp.]
MNNKESDHISLELLSRFFANEATPEECILVREWMAKSEKNKLLVQKSYNLLYISDTLCVMNEIDADSGLKKIKNRISTSNRRNKRHLWTQRIMIVLFVPLLINTVLQFIPEEEQVRYMEARSSSGLISSLELPDGSKVWLNAGSYIKYPVDFGKEKREVFITGEAYLSVVKDAHKKFIVQTLDDISIEVFGTEFNLDAYETNNKITATLIEGKICLCRTDSTDVLRKYTMMPEQQITYRRNTGEFVQQSTYIPKDIAWKNGQVVFRNTSFDEVLWILSKRFNVEFTVKKESLRNNSFTGSFTDQNLIRILEHFKISSGINYSQQQIVSEKGETLKTKIELY